MASVSTDKSGRRKIHFKHPARGRQTLRLGKVSKAFADDVRLRIERLIAAGHAGLHVDPETAKWLSALSSEFHDRLARVGLVTPREDAEPHQPKPVELRTFLTDYIAGRACLRPNTVRNLNQSKRLLTEFFGDDRSLATITAGDADAFKEHLLRNGYSPVTVSREVKRARQFFKAALRRDLVTANPFADVVAGSQANGARSFFVTRDMADAVMDACPDGEWRLIFALSRYGGLRCPSETLELKWCDIDWDRERIVIRESKTKQRVIPLFPELRPHLKAASDVAEPGAVYVIERYRSPNANLRTQLLRIIDKAGLDAWPRPFHNLRASRETELANEHPIHVVCDWIGNSEAIARKHYLQVTEEHFHKATQKATQHLAPGGCSELHRETEAAVNPADARCTAVQIPPRGVEPRFSD